MIEKILNEINRLKKELDGYSASEALDYIEAYINAISEEPANEDLEEYYKNEFLPKEWFAKPGQRTISQFNFFTARHFAEWQKQKDLEDSIKSDMTMPNKFYEKGRFDMREEMMKDAVEGEVVYKIGSSIIAPTDIRYKVMSDRVYIPNVKLGDKVKIIIVKEEQQ